MRRCSRRSLLAGLSAGSLAGAAGCVAEPLTTGTNGETIQDQAGREVTLPETVDRVVGVGPGALRLVCHLGLASRVVAVEYPEHADDDWTPPYTLAHPEFRELRTAGPQHGGDAESIVEAAPDLIVAATETPERASQLQSRTGVPTLWVDQGDFADGRDSLYAAWHTVGKAVDRLERAEELVEFVTSTREELRRMTTDAGADPSVFAGAVSHRGGQGVTSTEVPFPPFSMLGVRSVAGELAPNGNGEGGGTVKRTVSAERLLEWDPDTLFVNRANLPIVEEELPGSGLDELSAFRDGSVFGVHPQYYYEYNPSTMLANAYYVGSVVYPDAFDGVDPTAAADRVYRAFYGTELYDRLSDAFGPYGRIDL